MLCDTVWLDARLLTMLDNQPPVERGIVAATDGRIAYAGPAEGAPALDARETIHCAGRWITPALIDPHTHLVHAGDRSAEFEQRLQGRTYEQIAAAGGGILSTVAATRAASEDELVAAALPRLDALIAEGVAAVEVKSGYGLTVHDELKQLRAARRLEAARPVTIVTTLLAAHAVPPEFNGDPDGYVDMVCNEIIPTAAREGLADGVDAFCERIAFSPAQTRRVFQAAVEAGLPVRIHAEQLSFQGAAAFAAEFGALSADHLEHLDEAGAAAMARAGTVATLLPGAFYAMRETQVPPIEALRRHGTRMAIGTDCNPGTSPLTSLLLAMNMAATLFRLTVAECLAGVTREAARALGRLADMGTLEAGKRCDLAIWDIDRPAELVWRIGAKPLHRRVTAGQ